MMVKWANDGWLQANDGKMLVNDGEMLVNDGEMIVWYTHFTIIDEHFTIIIVWCKPSLAHLTIIEKLHRLQRDGQIWHGKLWKWKEEVSWHFLEISTISDDEKERYEGKS